MLLAIDAGHGGKNTGALEGLEKMLNLIVAAQAEIICEAIGIDVVMSRRSDVDVSWNKRSVLCDVADLTISVHHNASIISTGIKGLELYHWPSNNDVRSLCQESLHYVPLELRKNSAVRAATKDYPGAQHVCSVYSSPTVLLECCYLTNQRDLAFTRSEQYTETIGLYIANLALVHRRTMNV
jgi:N-acetylmuramoyl-L-alanine amidase